MVPRVVEALLAHFGSRLTTVVLAGSVARNDWIPYWSDLDIHVFLRGRPASGLAPDDLFEVRTALRALDPTDYGLARLQLRTFDASGYSIAFVAPWPGTSELAWGAPPVTPELAYLETAYGAKAEDGLTKLDRALAKLGEAYVCSSDQDVPDVVFGLGSIVKDALFGAGILLDGPERTLTARRDDLAKRVGDAVSDSGSALRFFTFARRWRQVSTNTSTLQQMFEDGHRSVTAISSWAAARFQLALLGQRVVELRRHKGWSQAKLAATAGLCKESVGLIEGPDYPLPKEPRYPTALEMVAKALEEPLVDLLALRTDAEIAASCFAHLLPTVQRRKVELQNGPRVKH